MITKSPTTQEAGIPITADQMKKLRMLEALIKADLADWLNVNDYPSDRWEAWQAFNLRFAFYDLITLNEYQALSDLYQTFRYLVPDPALLLDPDRYDLSDLQITRNQLEERMTLFDCFRGEMIVAGDPQSGKSCFTSVHTLHGRAWYDFRIITYKTIYPAAHGETEYLEDEEFVKEMSDLTELIEKRGQAVLKWKSEERKDEFLTRFHNSQIVIEEAHNVVHRERRTRLSFFWKEFTKVMFHYHCQPIFVTQYPKELDDEILDRYNQRVTTSINVMKNGFSDIDIYVKDTKQRKPIIELNRDTYKEIWVSDAPIAMSSNVTKKFVDNLAKERKAHKEETKEGE